MALLEKKAPCDRTTASRHWTRQEIAVRMPDAQARGETMRNLHSTEQRNRPPWRILELHITKRNCGRRTKPEGEGVLDDRSFMCRKVHESRKERDQHVLTNRAKGTHGFFVDELSFLDGACVWMGTGSGTVQEAKCFRLPTRSRAEDNWAREEPAAAVQATEALRRLIQTGGRDPAGANPRRPGLSQAAWEQSARPGAEPWAS